MNNGRIFVVEGVSNTGKTTLCEKLKERDNFKVIPEVADFTLECPKPSKNEEDELKNQDFFLEIETIRLNEAIKYASKGFNVILDRSIFSTLSIAYGLDKFKKYNVYEKMKEKYQNWLGKNNLNIIEKYIILYTNDFEIDIRNKSRKKSLSKNWLNSDFIAFQNEYFFSIFFSNKNNIFLNTSNKSTEEVYEFIKDCILPSKQ